MCVVVSCVRLRDRPTTTAALPAQPQCCNCPPPPDHPTARLRWVNQLRDDIKTESFSEEEDRILLEAHRMYGNRWTAIAKLLPGRCGAALWPGGLWQ